MTCRYHFISGYTAKIAGTEDGVQEPTATFSACFGEPFIVWHPTVYAKMLAERMHAHTATAWLLNTGWTGGKAGSPHGHRMPLKHTRAILDAIHSGSLNGDKSEFESFPVFNLAIPKAVDGVPSDCLHPERAWSKGNYSTDLKETHDSSRFMAELHRLAGLFTGNFDKYAQEASAEVKAAGPHVS